MYVFPNVERMLVQNLSVWQIYLCWLISRSSYSRGHQHGARGHQVARTDLVGRLRACSENNMNVFA